MSDTVRDLPVSQERRSLAERVSVVWLVPLAAVLVSLWVAWQSYSDRGLLIDIIFQQASGIRAGETELRFRDVTVGRVEDVGFSPTLETVRVSVRLDKSIAAFADDDATFWIVQPEVTTQGVSGLETVLSGVFIEASWDSEPGGLVSEHQGLDSAPLLGSGQSGLSITLTAGPGVLLTGSTPILHKGVEVGRIGPPELSPDGTVARAEAIVFAPYDGLVTSNTRFWDTSGFSFSLGANGAELNFSSIATLIAGGVAFDTVVSGGTAVASGRSYTVFADEGAARASLFQEDGGPVLNLTAVFEDNFAGLTVGAPVLLDGVNVGEVANLNGIVDLARFGDSRVRLSTSMELRTSKLGLPEATNEAAHDFLERRVAQGLRARLASASILTGGLRIEFINVPDPEPAALERDGDPFPLIPVAPAELSDVTATAEGVMERINNLPIEELLEAATTFLASATALASDEDMREIPSDVRGLVADVRAFTGSEDIQRLPAQASDLLSEFQALAGDLRRISDSIETAQAIDRVLAAVDAATEAATGVGASVEGVPALVERLSGVAAKAEELELQGLVTELSDTIGAAKALLADDGTRSLPTRLGATLAELEAALAELREGGAVENLNAALSSDTLAAFGNESDLNRTARAALRDVQDAARAIEQLARTLERNPNSIILGR